MVAKDQAWEKLPCPTQQLTAPKCLR